MDEVKGRHARPDLALVSEAVHTVITPVEPETALAALMAVFAAVVACHAFATTDDPEERWCIIGEYVLEFRRLVPKAAMCHLKMLDDRERKGTA